MKISYPPIQHRAFFAKKLFLLTSIFLGSQLNALTWDASGSSPSAPTGGAGTWDTSNSNWSDGVTNLTWDNSSNGDANFLGNLSANADISLGSNITVNRISFASGGSGSYAVVGGSFTLEVSSGEIFANRATNIQAEITGSNGLRKTGFSTLRLLSDNSYTGPTAVEWGILELRTTGSLPSSTHLTMGTGNNTAQLDLRANTTVSGLSVNTTNTSTIRTSPSASTNHSLTINSNLAAVSVDSVYSGVLTDGGSNQLSLIKAGTRSLTLTGVSTYTGDTVINDGELVVGVSGIGSLTSNILINNNGILSGSGSPTGDISVNAGGTFAPGNSAGTFTTTGSVDFGFNSVYAFELDGLSGNADRIVADSISIDSSAVFSFDLLGNLSNVNVTDSFTIIESTGAGPIIGTFGNLSAGGVFEPEPGLIFQVSGGSGSYGNDLVLTVTAIPEANVFSVGIGVFAIIFALRRRLRNRQS